MICYVDIEHLKVYDDPDERVRRLAGTLDVKYKLEDISGQPCLVQHYTRLTGKMLKELDIKALFISGNATIWPEYGEGEDSLAEMKRIIRSAQVPIFGFCGGLQLISLAHGMDAAPIGKLPEGQIGPDPEYAPGQIVEWGFTPINVVADDPVFKGLEGGFTVPEIHHWQVRDIPEGFKLLASTDTCRIQLIKRLDKPVYASQFHPEGFTEYPGDIRSFLIRRVYPRGVDQVGDDGRKILENFCRIAGVI